MATSSDTALFSDTGRCDLSGTLRKSSTSIIFQGIASSFAETTYLLSTTTRIPVEGSSVPPSESSAIYRTTDEMTYAPTSDVTTTTSPKTSTTTTTTATTTARSSQESSSGSQVLEPSTFFSTTTRTTTSSTPTTPPSDVAENDGATKTFQGNMRVVNGASFSEDLLDKNSDAYKQMEAEIMAFIMKVLEQCGLSQRVGSIQITGFRSGSVIVIFTVDITYESATDLTATFLEGYQSLNQTTTCWTKATQR
ncbi:cell wall protein DAN4-like [Pomacea canaliculata]|uniref:cell wall protein DAN4-like n=1 Tax=Pomacea canaliculata TaxID=400727 RepID=UPI000D730A2D|nr:cell wall protein DAN4-like [Pomacea canaliculata]